VRDHYPYDYAVLRVVPRVEREEFVNVGVIVSCPARDFLEARIELDEQKLAALDSALDVEAIRTYLAAIPIICAGGEQAGPTLGSFCPQVGPKTTFVLIRPCFSTV